MPRKMPTALPAGANNGQTTPPYTTAPALPMDVFLDVSFAPIVLFLAVGANSSPDRVMDASDGRATLCASVQSTPESPSIQS